ncbi:MAG: metal-dependent hydrolase [Rhodospirillales bacterium]
MDSVTQFALGSAVGAAAFGPKIGARRAVLLGGILGSLPDFDNFLPSSDSVEAFVTHRGWSHSLIVQAALTPLFAEPLARFIEPLRDHRLQTYLGVYLVFATHALLDAMTIYGTQLLWPLVKDPFGVGSIFIIDPIYTLPLLILTLWGLFRHDFTPRFETWLRRGLVASTAYLILTMPLQTVMKMRAADQLTTYGVEVRSANLLTIPAPFSVLYWKTVAVEDDRYVNLYSPLFGGETTAYGHPRRGDLIPALNGDPTFDSLSAFAKGYFSLGTDGDDVIYSDLRMGLTPNYAFRFRIARLDGGDTVAVEPQRVRGDRRQDGDLEWLLSGIGQDAAERPAERHRTIAPPGKVESN